MDEQGIFGVIDDLFVIILSVVRKRCVFYLNIKMDRLMSFSKEKSKQYSIHFLLSSIPMTCLILFSGIHTVINFIGRQ